MTNLQDSILAAYFNADPLPLTTTDIWQSMDQEGNDFSITETVLAILDLENDGYLKPGIRSVLTDKGKDYAFGLAAAMLLIQVAPEAIEFAGTEREACAYSGEGSCGTGGREVAPIGHLDSKQLSPAGMIFAAPVANTSLVTDLHGGSEGELVGNADSLSVKVNLYYAEKCSVIPGARPDPSRLTNEIKMLSGVSRAEAEKYIKDFSHYRSAWRIEEIDIPHARGGNSDGLHVTQVVADESDRHVAVAVLDSMERRNGCVPQTDMPLPDAVNAEVSSASASISDDDQLRGDGDFDSNYPSNDPVNAPIMEALFPEIYAAAKRCEDVCSFPDCGSLAHRNCPCGARTCFNHMYASDASLADRNQMGFCRDCTEAIQEEQAGIERHGRA